MTSATSVSQQMIYRPSQPWMNLRAPADGHNWAKAERIDLTITDGILWNFIIRQLIMISINNYKNYVKLSILINSNY